MIDDRDEYVIKVGQGLDRVPPFDPWTRRHFWAAPLLFRVEAEAFKAKAYQVSASRENLVAIIAPACWYCNKPLSEAEFDQPCEGPDDDQPSD